MIREKRRFASILRLLACTVRCHCCGMFRCQHYIISLFNLTAFTPHRDNSSRIRHVEHVRSACSLVTTRRTLGSAEPR